MPTQQKDITLGGENMDLDKAREEYWRRNFPDPQEAKEWATCEYTGYEIYEGDECILLPNGKYLLNDYDVLLGYIGGRKVIAGEEELN